MIKKIWIRVFTAILMLSSSLTYAATGSSSLLGKDKAAEIIVNNRVLAKVHGKPITVYDIMKKMDMLFYKQFPEYASFPEARFQFYKVNWKFVFQDLIDKELMLIDAEENKLVTNNGDVRQEIEQMLGPNIIASLDEAGLTLDEATKMVNADITIRRIMMYRVGTKAQKRVTPQAIREEYTKFSSDPKNSIPPTWDYRVISIRDTDSSQGAAIAALIHKSLQDKDSNISLEEKVKQVEALDPSASVNISPEYVHVESEISESYKGILAGLTIGEYSKPIEQKSRSQKGTVYRIFFLKNKNSGGVPPFSEVESQIKGKLLQEAQMIETDLYLGKLRAKYSIDNEHLKAMLPEDFEPFALK